MKPRLVEPVGEYLLSIQGVMAKTQIGKTKLLELVKSGAFPQPKHIGASARWRGADVDSWIREAFTTLDPVVKLRAVR